MQEKQPQETTVKPAKETKTTKAAKSTKAAATAMRSTPPGHTGGAIPKPKGTTPRKGPMSRDSTSRNSGTAH